MLSSYTAGGTGCLVLVDLETGEGESLELPGDSGAWALLPWGEGELLVGTCSERGYLHRLDLATRSWREPLRDPGETYIWNLCRGSDGMAYGGTWPGGVLLRYDPVRHVLENMGKLSDNPENMYVRRVWGEVPGSIIAAVGEAEAHLAVWSMATGAARRFGSPGESIVRVTAEYVCVDSPQGELAYYDTRSFAPMAAPAGAGPDTEATELESKLRTTSYYTSRVDRETFLAVRGQEYCVWRPSREERPLYRLIPTSPPATRILTVTTDEAGKVWGSCGFGQTVFSFDPATGASWNSRAVCDRGGEVFGMRFIRGRLFMSAYSAGDHVVYDPARPWNQWDNDNPRTLRSVHPELIRPTGKSVVGPDGAFWTGWQAAYGVYGGGISRVDPDTLDVTSWYDPVREQMIAGLDADCDRIYFATGGAANGLRNREGPFAFVAWDAQGRDIARIMLPRGVTAGQVCALEAEILVACTDRIVRVDAKSVEPLPPLLAESGCSCAVRRDSSSAYLFCGEDLQLFRAGGELRKIARVPASVGTAAVAPDGTLYFASGAELYALAGIRG